MQRQPSAQNGPPGPPLAHYASVAHVARVVISHAAAPAQMWAGVAVKP